MLYLLPVLVLVVAYAEYPEETMDTLYTIGHTTISTAFYLRQKACPQPARRKKMSRPKPSEAASLLSMTSPSVPKEE